MQSGAKLAPKSHQKSIPRGIKKLIDFGIDFLSILAPFWEPSWSHVGHLFRAKTPQDAPRTATRRPKTPPRQPKTPQDAPRHPQDAPKAPKTLPRRRFWKDLDPLDLDFGPSRPRFFRFWEDFWKTFGLTMFRTPWAIVLLSYFSFWRGGGSAALLRCWIF